MKSKTTAVIVLLLMVVIFTLQNTAVVSINFMFWSFSLAQALMVFLILAVGIIIGLMISSLSRKTTQPAAGRPAEHSLNPKE